MFHILPLLLADGIFRVGSSRFALPTSLFGLRFQLPTSLFRLRFQLRPNRSGFDGTRRPNRSSFDGKSRPHKQGLGLRALRYDPTRRVLGSKVLGSAQPPAKKTASQIEKETLK